MNFELSLLRSLRIHRGIKTITVPILALCMFAGSSNCAHAGTIKDVADLITLFKDAGFKAPTITKNETETTFNLSIQGSLVDHTFFDDSGTFVTDFEFNFWRGTITFSQVDGQINPDSVTAGMSIYHQAGMDRPHPGDNLAGEIFTFPAKLLKQGDNPINFAQTVRHPANHYDNYNTSFSVAGANDNITGWTFTAKGEHVIPTPAMLPGLISMGIAAWRKRRQEELAGEQGADPVLEEV